MAENKEIRKEEIIVDDNLQKNGSLENLSAEQFLQQIDNININLVQNTNNQKTNDSNTNANTKTTTNNTNSQSNSSTLTINDTLKVRILKKNSFDTDINADLRNPMSDSTQTRVVEKNDLEGNVVADLRDPIYQYYESEEKYMNKVASVENIIKPNMTISGTTVAEGDKAIFKVSFDKTSNKTFKVTFSLNSDSANSSDYDENIIVKDSRGNIIPKNSDGSYTVPVGEISLSVEVQTNNDNNFEGNEKFLLNGKTEFMLLNTSAVGSIVDDGSLSNGLNDDRVLSVNDVTVNEGSPYVVFEVSGASNQLASLSLANQNDDGSDLSTLQYFDGTSWITYTSGNVSLDSNGKLLVRVALNPEQETSLDGPEIFNLVATNTGGTSATGIATIKDDGTGDYYPDNITGTPYTQIELKNNHITLDDDRLLSINNVEVNEGSPYVVFEVSGTIGQSVKLTLGSTETIDDKDATGGITTPTDGSVDYGTSFQYSNGSAWVDYIPNSYIEIPAGRNLLVRTSIVDDNLYEISETFTLKVEYTNGKNVIGIATIKDDGTGQWFDGSSGTGSDTAPENSVLDNDKPILTLNDATVEEGSTIVFAGSLSKVSEYAEEITLSTSLTGMTAESGDFNQIKTSWTVTYVDSSSVTQTLSVDTNGKFTLPAGVTAFNVNIPTINDSVYEGAETFTLRASATSSYITTTDTAIGTIKDDGTASDGDDSNSTSDDDRPLSINNIEVNENSPYAIFTVSGATGQSVKLTLGSTETTADKDATEGTTTPTDGSVDYNSNIYYFGSSGWTLYTPNSYVEIPAGGNLLVGTYIVDDNLYEISETFTLKAEYTNGKNATGIATIKDDGTGQWFDGSSGTGSSTAPESSVLNNDKPTLSIDNINVAEGEDAVFTVSLSNKSTQDVVFNLSSTNGEATTTNDYTPTYYVSTDGGVTWNSTPVTSATITAGSTSIKVKLATVEDSTNEADETFKLNATVTSGDTTNGSTSTSGTATIIDDDNLNLAPTSENKTVTTNEDTAYILQTADFAFIDSNVADSLTKIKITTLETKGVLQYKDSSDNWVDVILDQEITVDDITNGKLRFNPDLNENGTAYTTFKFVVSDGTTYSITPNTITVNVTPINDAPILDLDANNSTTIGSNYLTSYALGKKGVSIGDIDVGITDIDDTNIESATITLTNAKAGDLLFTNNLPTAISVSAYNSSTGVITLTGSATKTDYEKAIESIKFYNATGTDKTDRTISVIVNDGDLNSNTATTTIKVATNALSITTNHIVEEGKTAIFTVSLAQAKSEATTITLSLSGTSTSADYDLATFMYESSPGVWTAISGNTITIPAGQTSIDVKIKTINDGALVDDGENLILTGTITSGTTDMANTVASASTIITELPSLTVSSPAYALEGNSAIFEVGLTNVKTTSTSVTLGVSGNVISSDYSTSSYQYSTDGGNTWTTVNFNVNGSTLTIPSGTTTNIPSILVKITISNDGTSDNLESLVLTATTTDNKISSYGNSASNNTIVVEPLALNVTEKKDGVTTVSTSITTTADTNYTYIKINDGLNGTVIQNPNGTLTYNPNTDFSGSDSFSYQMVNKTTGEIITSVANVTVNAVADTPDVGIGANIVVIENIINSNAWYSKESSGSVSSSEDVSGSLNLNTTTSFSIGKGDFVYQSFGSALSGSFDINVSYSGGGLTIYGGIKSGNTITSITKLSTSTLTSGNKYSLDMTGYDTIIVGNINSSAATISSFNTTQTVAANTVMYNVDINNTLSDTDNKTTGTINKEELQSVTIQVKDSSNIVIASSGFFNKGTYDSATKTWTLTQAQLDSLKVTVSSTLATNGFKLEVTATSKELSNGSTATKTATISIINSDDSPTIGDQILTVTNGNANTNGSNIDTDYSSNTPNVFSWNPSKSYIPELYANGQKIVITYDNTTGKVTGTIDNGATTVFTTTILMADNNATTLNYTQGSTLLGVVNMVDGGIVLPGGGNNDSILLGFKKSATDSTIVVDALVSAHNLIEDSTSDLTDSDAEHTVNTNNYYIGVDSNNMNAGDQLKFDFEKGNSVDQVSEMNIKLFNFGSVKSGDELFITVITKNPAYTLGGSNPQFLREKILLTQDSDYTTELEYTVKSATGNPIVGVEFLAGNNSSFKLGIKSIGSINYNDTFEMKFAYDISDIDGDTDGGLTTIKVGNGTVNSSLDYQFDSKIIFDSSDKIIDGGTGTDTLVLGTGIDIDFSTYANSIKNIEKIDLTNSSGTNNLTNIKLSDIVNITDSNKLLSILGDSGDSISLKSEANKVWALSNTDATYNNYINSGDNSVSLKIDKDITVSII